jgi:hypothetical protein
VGELLLAHSSELTGGEVGRVREIYEQAFAPQLRVPFGELTATGPVDLFLAAIDGGEPVGFAALRILGSAGWTFLRCYAIAADRRGSYMHRYGLDPEHPLTAAALASIGQHYPASR